VPSLRDSLILRAYPGGLRLGLYSGAASRLYKDAFPQGYSTQKKAGSSTVEIMRLSA